MKPWINVKDQLPKNDTECLVIFSKCMYRDEDRAVTDGAILFAEYYNDNFVIYLEENYSPIAGTVDTIDWDTNDWCVRFWRPLPLTPYEIEMKSKNKTFYTEEDIRIAMEWGMGLNDKEKYTDKQFNRLLLAIEKQKKDEEKE